MRLYAFLLAAMISMSATAQTTGCQVYGNTITCLTTPPPKINTTGCGTQATCFLNGYMKSHEQYQKQQIQKERLENLRLQNDQLRLQNQEIQNQLTHDNQIKDDNEKPNQTEIKAAYCLGALNNSGHNMEVTLFQKYLSSNPVTTIGKSILDASKRQGLIDRDFAMRHETQCVTQCTLQQSKKSIDECSAICEATLANQTTSRQINSCKGANFLPH